MYAQSQEGGAAAGDGAASGPVSDEEVTDVDFEEVEEDEAK
jgi:hypothetical protein